MLRVYLYAPRAVRSSTSPSAIGTSENTAAEEVDRIDKRAARLPPRVVRHHFGDPVNYDLCIDTSVFAAEQRGPLVVRGGPAARMIEEPVHLERPSSLFASLHFGTTGLLWFGLLVSNLGTSMQFTALGYSRRADGRGSPRQAALYLGSWAWPGPPRCSAFADRGRSLTSIPRRRILLITEHGDGRWRALLLAVLASLHRLDLIWLVLGYRR